MEGEGGGEEGVVVLGSLVESAVLEGDRRGRVGKKMGVV